MKLLILASWYPVITPPNGGIFIYDQARTLASHYPDLDICVAYPGRAHISPVHLVNSYYEVKSLPKQHFRQISSNLWEYFFPVINWSKLLPGGFPATYRRAWQRCLQRLMKQWGRPELIHAHVSFPAGWLAFSSLHRWGIPYLLTEHMSPFPFPSYIDRDGKPLPCIEQAFQHASSIIAVSPSLQSEIRRYGLGDAVVVPNTIDEKLFFPSKNKYNKFSCLFLGHLGMQKGIDDLIKAIAKWRPKNNIQFLIAGAGEEHNVIRIKNMARKYNVTRLIKWLGPLEHKEAAIQMQKSHVFILPSRHESFGVVLLEALACGIPVITTRCGGPEYLIRDQRLGFLTEVGDIAALASAMSILYKNYNTYSSSWIRSYYDSEFSARQTTKKLMNLYKKIINAT